MVLPDSLPQLEQTGTDDGSPGVAQSTQLSRNQSGTFHAFLFTFAPNAGVIKTNCPKPDGINGTMIDHRTCTTRPQDCPPSPCGTGRAVRMNLRYRAWCEIAAAPSPGTRLPPDIAVQH